MRDFARRLDLRSSSTAFHPSNIGRIENRNIRKTHSGTYNAEFDEDCFAHGLVFRLIEKQN